MEQIIDIEANLERIKEFFESYGNKLDFNSTKVRITDENGNIETLEFKEAKKRLDMYCNSYKYPLVAENCLFILGAIPGRLEMIKEKIDESFEELVKIIDTQNQVIDQLKDEIELKESDIKELEDKIELMKEEHQNNRFDNMQNQINTLMMQLMGRNAPNNSQNNVNFEGKHPNDYFNEEIETPIGDDIDEDSEPLSVPNPNSNVQKAHDEVLELIKGEGLYPLHKVNPDLAKDKYIEFWTYVMMRHNLDENDYPSFVDNLEDFSEEEDNYLDKVR